MSLSRSRTQDDRVFKYPLVLHFISSLTYFRPPELAEAARKQEDWSGAEARVVEALPLCAHLGLQAQAPPLLETLAQVYAQSGDPEQALFCLAAANTSSSRKVSR